MGCEGLERRFGAFLKIVFAPAYYGRMERDEGYSICEILIAFNDLTCLRERHILHVYRIRGFHHVIEHCLHQ